MDFFIDAYIELMDNPLSVSSLIVFALAYLFVAGFIGTLIVKANKS